MKDILNIIRFDFLTANPLAGSAFLIVAAFCILLSLFISPIICGYIIFVAMAFVIPLQNIAEKSGFHKLYGILPVQRKNITRARFLYIFLVHFAAELLEIVFAVIAMHLKLYRVLPNQNSELMQMVKTGFSDNPLAFGIVIGMFAFLCLMFSYMEMMGQIFGRENEMKTLLITLGVFTVLAVGFFWLSDHNMIPTLKLPDLPTTTSGRVLLGVAINVAMFGICLLFGEITANRLAKREL